MVEFGSGSEVGIVHAVCKFRIDHCGRGARTYYKQPDPAPRYHARDVVLWMATRAGYSLRLSSATPSVETVWASKRQAE